MMCKVCPKCKNTSYSAATEGNWKCPYCNENLTLIQAQPIK